MLSSSRPPHGAPWRQRGRGSSGHMELRSGNRIQALPPSCKWGALPTHSPGLSSLQARFRGDRTMGPEGRRAWQELRSCGLPLLSLSPPWVELPNLLEDGGAPGDPCSPACLEWGGER